MRARAFARFQKKLMASADAEIDRFDQRRFDGAFGEERQRITRHGAIMASAFNRVLDGAVFAHQRNRVFEIGIGDVALLKRPLPERAFFIIAAAER